MKKANRDIYSLDPHRSSVPVRVYGAVTTWLQDEPSALSSVPFVAFLFSERQS
jgi:hypothetical protein